jgi:hypothetical protein
VPQPSFKGTTSARIAVGVAIVSIVLFAAVYAVFVIALSAD